MKALSYIFLFFYLWSFSTKGQELPPIQNFKSSSYNAGNQNWAISQSQDKRIYVANNEGLLEYNCANWRLYPSPNKTIMRSVSVFKDMIFTGSYMDFGIWKSNNFGELDYTSISQKLKIKLVEDEEFWHIIGVEDWVVFQSLNRIYVYNWKKETIKVIDSKGVINKMFELDNIIYFQRLNKGIYKIENGKDAIFIDDSIIRENEIVNLFLEEKNIVVVTRNNGFFTYQDGQLKKWKNINQKLKNLSIYSAIQLKDKNFVLGTISNGLVYLNKTQGIIYEVNRSNGILNNTVLSIYEDADDNVWAGLDNGISCLNRKTSIKVFNDNQGILGSVYASAILNETLYLGTNQGLFCKPLNDAGQFDFIEKTHGQVWCLKIINGQLFCGHDKGTFLIDEKKASLISDVQGTWKIKMLNSNSNLIIQGNYDGLYILEKSLKGWGLKNKVEGFNNSSRSFEVLEDKIFVNHEYKGLFQLSVNQDFSRIKEVTVDTSMKGFNSSIARFKGDIIYAYEKGVFKYNVQEKAFSRDSVLSSIYTKENYTSGRIVPNETEDKFWVFTKNNLTLVSSSTLSKAYNIQTFPLIIEARKDIIEYENIINLNGLSQYIIGTRSGYITIDINSLVVKDFKVYISHINNGINKGHSSSKHLVDKMKHVDFRHNDNNINIHYYTPEYHKYFQPTYQFQLVGIYDIWSEWTSESNVFFENLPSGDYTFNVRSKVCNKVSDNMASYNFSILRPWYYSNLMMAVYMFSAVLLAFFIHNVYRIYYKNRQRKIIEDNKRELDFRKLQNEQDIIKIKNEQLKIDCISKSKELATIMMSMARKNELLSEIKKLLNKIEDKKSLMPTIKMINQNLNHDKNWDFFKEAFENVDRDFFKNLTMQHHDLSPNDLKLCAYLRLNLSSKEISQIINISPKSVEVKRYRLRKKLNLKHNENLINYILDV